MKLQRIKILRCGLHGSARPLTLHLRAVIIAMAYDKVQQRARGRQDAEYITLLTC